MNTEHIKQVGLAATLPEGFRWGHDAMEQFEFGKQRATEAILAALTKENWLGEPTDSTYPFPHDGIVCFHCGKRFRTPGSARDHFGEKPHMPNKPTCTQVESQAKAQAPAVTRSKVFTILQEHCTGRLNVAADEVAALLPTTTPAPVDANQSTDPVHQEPDGWYFWEETWADRHGPYSSQAVARFNLALYVAVQLEHIPDAVLVAQLIHQRKVTIPPLETVLASEIAEALANHGVTVDEATSKSIVDVIMLHISLRNRNFDEWYIKRLISEHYDFLVWKNWTKLHRESIQFLCDLLLGSKDKVDEAMKSWNERNSNV